MPTTRTKSRRSSGLGMGGGGVLAALDNTNPRANNTRRGRTQNTNKNGIHATTTPKMSRTPQQANRNTPPPPLCPSPFSQNGGDEASPRPLSSQGLPTAILVSTGKGSTFLEQQNDRMDDDTASGEEEEDTNNESIVSDLSSTSLLPVTNKTLFGTQQQQVDESFLDDDSKDGKEFHDESSVADDEESCSSEEESLTSSDNDESDDDKTDDGSQSGESEADVDDVDLDEDLDGDDEVEDDEYAEAAMGDDDDTSVAIPVSRRGRRKTSLDDEYVPNDSGTDTEDELEVDEDESVHRGRVRKSQRKTQTYTSAADVDAIAELLGTTNLDDDHVDHMESAKREHPTVQVVEADTDEESIEEVEAVVDNSLLDESMQNEVDAVSNRSDGSDADTDAFSLSEEEHFAEEGLKNGLGQVAGVPGLRTMSEQSMVVPDDIDDITCPSEESVNDPSVPRMLQEDSENEFTTADVAVEGDDDDLESIVDLPCTSATVGEAPPAVEGQEGKCPITDDTAKVDDVQSFMGMPDTTPMVGEASPDEKILTDHDQSCDLGQQQESSGVQKAEDDDDGTITDEMSLNEDLATCDESQKGYSANVTDVSDSDVASVLCDPCVTEPTKREEKMSKPKRVRREGEIKQGKWSVGAKIGVGSFGVVRVGMNSKTGGLMAVKSMELSPVIMKDIRREVKLLKALDHVNIVRYLGAEMDEAHLHIFQEWVPGGSVTSLLHKFGAFSMTVVRNYLSQILQGLAYLHTKRVLHRDIKGGNVLVSDEGIVKLADFGSSRQLLHLQNDMMEKQTVRGTPYFMAPEVFEETYGSKADVWSVGCVAFQMSTGLPPWKELNLTNPMSLFRHLGNTEGPPPRCWPTERHDTAYFPSLLDNCFQRDPTKRPTAEDLLRNSFFTAYVPSSDDDLSQGRGVFSPGGDSQSTWGSTKPIEVATALPQVMNETTFLSPPLPRKIKPVRQEIVSPLPPSPNIDPREWPMWARERLGHKTASPARGRNSPPVPKKHFNNLSLMHSLARSEDSSVVSGNPFRKRLSEGSHGSSKQPSFSSVSTLDGLAFVEETPGGKISNPSIGH